MGQGPGGRDHRRRGRIAPGAPRYARRGGAARDRAGARDRALFDPSKEAILARKYEAATERAMYRAIREFREVEASHSEKGPDPIATDCEATGPLGSFFPGGPGRSAPPAPPAPPARPSPRGGLNPGPDCPYSGRPGSPRRPDVGRRAGPVGLVRGDRGPGHGLRRPDVDRPGLECLKWPSGGARPVPNPEGRYGPKRGPGIPTAPSPGPCPWNSPGALAMPIVARYTPEVVHTRCTDSSPKCTKSRVKWQSELAPERPFRATQSESVEAISGR